MAPSCIGHLLGTTTDSFLWQPQEQPGLLWLKPLLCMYVLTAFKALQKSPGVRQPSLYSLICSLVVFRRTDLWGEIGIHGSSFFTLRQSQNVLYKILQEVLWDWTIGCTKATDNSGSHLWIIFPFFPSSLPISHFYFLDHISQ